MPYIIEAEAGRLPLRLYESLSDPQQVQSVFPYTDERKTEPLFV